MTAGTDGVAVRRRRAQRRAFIPSAAVRDARLYGRTPSTAEPAVFGWPQRAVMAWGLAACLTLGGCASPPAQNVDRDTASAGSRGRRAFEQGHFNVAADAYRSALQRARLRADSADIGDHAYNLAACLIGLGRPDEARDLLREARAEFEKNRDLAGQADTWLLEAKIARSRKMRDEAGQLLEKTLALLPVKGEEARKAQAYAAMAELACDADDAAAARTALTQAHAAAGGSADGAALAGLAQTEGRVLRLEGKPKEAADQLDRAALLFREAGRYRDMAEAMALAAGSRADAGQNDLAAEAYLDAAQSLYAQGDAVGALRSISSALASAEGAGREDLKARAASLFNEIKGAVNSEQWGSGK